MTGRRRARALVAATWVIAAAWVGRAPAAPPAVDYLFPAGGRQGLSFTVTAGGKADAKDAKIEPWPAKVWADCPGLEFSAREANGTFNVRIAADAPVGPHLVRVYNDDGSSAPRVFVVGRHAEAVEAEPNDDARTPHPIEAVPATVNGRLDKSGDADSFSVQVEAGRWIVADLACRRLGAPVDPTLRVLDPDGTELAFNHDTFGLDPLVAHRAERSGRYVVQVAGFAYPPAADVRFTGSKAAAYRLLLTTGPYARGGFPAGGARPGKTSFRLFGWNLGPTGRELPWEWDAAGVPPGAEEAFLSPPAIDNTPRVGLGDIPEQAEPEPNDSPGEAQRVDLPVTMNGRIGRPGDVDRFAFRTTKGERFGFAVTSASLDLPLDPVLAVEDATGNQLARADDDPGGTPDPKLDWTAPADGTFVVAVSDLAGQGGDEYVYRLAMKPGAPGFRASVDTASLRVEVGKAADLKVTVAREGGHAAPLAVAVTGLPDGVTATTSGASPKAGPLTLTLSAAAAAAAFSGPIRVVVVSTDDQHPAARAATFDLAPDGMIRRTDTLWLTVTRPPAATQPAATKPR